MGREFRYFGGFLFLDFVDTEVRGPRHQEERLESFSDLKDWASGHPDLSPHGELVSHLKGSASDQAHILESYKGFRKQLREFVETLYKEGKPAINESRLEFLRRALAKHPIQNSFRVVSGKRFDQVRAQNTFLNPGPLTLQHPIALSFVDFLENSDPKRLKKCANANCSHFFYDTSKNGSRRWCTMDSCGNIMKARAFYARKKT